MLFLKRLLSYLPTPIPTGMTKFTKWLDSIVELCGPIADEESLKWVISNEVMRLPSTRHLKAKNYFVTVLKKFAANQLAAATVNQIKDNQLARATEQKLKEDTLVKEVSDAQKS